MANSEARKIIVLKSSDGVDFEVAKSTAMVIKMIQHAMEDDTASGPIPLPNVTANVLSLVLKYCDKHATVTNNAEDGASAVLTTSNLSDEDLKLKAWDKNFINVDTATLYVILMASHCLGIDGLLDLAAKKTADMIACKNIEEIRGIFNIENDFTPEENQQIRRENAWASI